MSDDTLAGRVLIRMREKNLRQADINRATGFNRAFLSDLLSGKKKSINYEAITKLAQALDTSPSWLSALDVPGANTRSQDREIARLRDRSRSSGDWDVETTVSGEQNSTDVSNNLKSLERFVQPFGADSFPDLVGTDLSPIFNTTDTRNHLWLCRNPGNASSRVHAEDYGCPSNGIFATFKFGSTYHRMRAGEIAYFGSGIVPSFGDEVILFERETTPNRKWDLKAFVGLFVDHTSRVGTRICPYGTNEPLVFPWDHTIRIFTLSSIYTARWQKSEKRKKR